MSSATTRTPYLRLDSDRVVRNIQRLRDQLAPLGVPLRPHLKTAKSVEVARLLFDGGTGPITVSTLAEAEGFAAAGCTEILYAVGITPAKLPDVVALRRSGVDLVVLLDSVIQAEAVAAVSNESGVRIPALIEINCDDHRGGVEPDSPELIAIARALSDGGEVRGVMTHAGESYFCYTEAELVKAAENERSVAVRAAESLRDKGFEAPVVSVGSTPTAHFARDLTGVTEIRAGNFVFFDLVMAGIGVCTVDDLALSVVTTVIGHRPDQGWILTDAGWMATSRDRGTARQAVDQGYGLVCAEGGEVIADLLMTDASQEHGILSLREGSSRELPELPVGTRLRILPNHACATAAQHASYQLATGETWPRITGW
ncbi:alanine racemase [Kribbella deserti]|uniref:Alanine racemase n=1 Tax=Kribbella deserti TaxID=1926257 RepID=A0ABV6QSI1_9ACTN